MSKTSAIDFLMQNNSVVHEDDIKQICYELTTFCAFPLLTDQELEAVKVFSKSCSVQQKQIIRVWASNWFASVFNSRAEWLCYNIE